MLAVGAAILLAGYTFVFWGNKIRTGAGVGLADVVIPGHYATGPLPPVAGASAGVTNPKPGEHLADVPTRPAPFVPQPTGPLPTYPAPRLP